MDIISLSPLSQHMSHMSVTFREFVVRSTLAMSTLSWIKVCNHGRCDGGKRGLAEAWLRRSQDFMQKLPKQTYKNRKIKDRKTTPRLRVADFAPMKLRTETYIEIVDFYTDHLSNTHQRTEQDELIQVLDRKSLYKNE